jgi:hypothetical protein
MLTSTADTTSWNVLFVCIILFVGLHNVVICILRYRLKLAMAGHLALQQFKWIRKYSAQQSCSNTHTRQRFSPCSSVVL